VCDAEWHENALEAATATGWKAVLWGAGKVVDEKCDNADWERGGRP
jgi:hypothetical protein